MKNTYAKNYLDNLGILISIFSTDYVTHNGPNQNNRKGPNKFFAKGPNVTLRTGPGGLAKGPNPALCRGPAGRTRGPQGVPLMV